MTRYLVRWEDKGHRMHSMVFTVEGVRRLMGKMFLQRRSDCVAVYELSADIAQPPKPVRVYYDHVFDRLTIYDLRGRRLDGAGLPIRGRVYWEPVGA